MNSSLCSLYKRIKRQVGPLREEWAFVHFADGAIGNPFPKRWELGLLKLVKAKYTQTRKAGRQVW